MAKDLGAFPPANTLFPVSIAWAGWENHSCFPHSLCFSATAVLKHWIFEHFGCHNLHLHGYELKLELSHAFLGNFYTENKNILSFALQVNSSGLCQWGDTSNPCDKCHYLSCQAECKDAHKVPTLNHQPSVWRKTEEEQREMCQSYVITKHITLSKKSWVCQDHNNDFAGPGCSSSASCGFAM